jgi:signal transduction histidine kinase
VDVDSEPGKGTMMSVTLPLAKNIEALPELAEKAIEIT